jgi:hypothetical protein
MTLRWDPPGPVRGGLVLLHGELAAANLVARRRGDVQQALMGVVQAADVPALAAALPTAGTGPTPHG